MSGSPYCSPAKLRKQWNRDVSQMGSQEPKRDIADYFRPYMRSNLPKAVPTKRPSPCVSDESDEGLDSSHKQKSPRTPTAPSRLKDVFKSPYKSPYTPGSQASVRIPIRSPRPGLPCPSSGHSTPSIATPVRRTPLFSSTRKTSLLHDEPLAFAEIPTLAQSVVKDGKVVAVRDSEEEDSDSLISLDEILGRNREEVPTDSSSPPDLGEDDPETLRERSLSLFTSGRSKALVGRDKLRQLTSKANNFNLDLHQLVSDQCGHEETEKNIKKAKEGYERSKDQELLKRKQLSGTNLLDALTERGEIEERLRDAVERTEVLATAPSWSLFGTNPPCSEKGIPDYFLADLAEMDPWTGCLAEPASRDRALLSGYVAEKAAEGNFQALLGPWSHECLSREEIDGDMRRALAGLIAADKSNWTKECDKSYMRMIEMAFTDLGADPAKLQCADKIVPETPTFINYNTQRSARLLTLIQVLSSTFPYMAFRALERFVQILMRLAIDGELMQDPHLCLGVENAISSLLNAGEETSHSVAMFILADLEERLKEPFFQSQLLSHILPTSSTAAYLRIRLATLFIVGSGGPKAENDDLSPNINLDTLTAYLDDPRFDVSRAEHEKDIDYTSLSALAFLFETALADGGRPSHFDDHSHEREFNRKIDLLADRIQCIISAIPDAGASHLRRTEAKEALRALHPRLLYAVRTKPRPKENVFGGRKGVDFRAEERSAFNMQQFLGGRSNS